MANFRATRTKAKNAANALQNKAKAVKNIQAANNAIANSQKKQATALTTESIRRMYNLLSANATDKTRMLLKITQALPGRLADLANKYRIKSVALMLGFDNENAFIEYIQKKLLATKARDKSSKEFFEGAIGRQNDFLGGIFELCVKYGPIRRIIISMADNAVKVANDEIHLAKKTGGLAMFRADGSKIVVKEPFSKLLTANRIDINTVDGAKESLDFGSLSFNLQGLCFFPLPVEIKLPRAAAGVAKQFVSFPERVAEALKSKNKIFAYFNKEEFDGLKKTKGFDKFMSGHDVLGLHEVDGRKMVKVAINPEKLMFNNDNKNPMVHNRLVVRPDSRYWNPAGPDKVPLPEPEKIFEVAKVNGRPVSIEPSSTEKGNGFNFWRMLVPSERRFLVDIYKSIYD